MDGFFLQGLKGAGGDPVVLWGSFAPNGSSTPDSASNAGPVRNFTTAYAATGAFTVTLPAGYTPVGTPTIGTWAQAESLTEHFAVMAVGAYDASTRSFVIQAHRNGTGREIAANAGARIHFVLIFNNSTGG